MGQCDLAALVSSLLLGQIPFMYRDRSLRPSPPPGIYVLTLCRGNCGIRLLLRLPPGVALTLCHDPARLDWCWRRDPFPFF